MLKLNKLTLIQRRFLTFIFGCIGVRLLLVLAVKKAKKEHLSVLGYFGLLVAFGFWFTYFWALSINLSINSFLIL